MFIKKTYLHQTFSSKNYYHYKTKKSVVKTGFFVMSILKKVNYYYIINHVQKKKKLSKGKKMKYVQVISTTANCMRANKKRTN